MFNGRQGPGGINGSNPLIYQGSTPNMVTFNRRPTVQDGFSWPIGMWWIIPIDLTFTTGEVWTLVSKAENINTWKKLHGGGGPTPPSSIATINKIFLTTPGAGTYTPTTGMSECYVECVGGGGGGSATASAGSNRVALNGGAGGGYCAKLFTASEIGSSQSYVIGAGGAGGVAPAPGSGTVVSGSSGVATTFGSFLTANGGTGGSSSSVAAGGTATGGDINISGGSALTFALQIPLGGSTYLDVAGSGGGSMYGQAGGSYAARSGTASVNGLSGTGYGSGAGGAMGGFGPAVVSGTAGQDGIIIITEYIG